MAYVPSDFAYKHNFPTLTESQIQAAIQYVEAEWYSVLSFWGCLPAALRDAKRKNLESLLIAWYLADLYPKSVRGIVSNSGMVLSKKKIGGTDLEIEEYAIQDQMRPLLSNAFGIKAYQALTSAPERFRIYG